MDYTRSVVDYLNELGLGITAYREVPSKRPTEDEPPRPFAVVELIGCTAESRFQRSPSVDIDCWAPSPHVAESLSLDVASAMEAMPERRLDIAHVSVTTIYSSPDIESGTPRYVVSCDIYANK